MSDMSDKKSLKCFTLGHQIDIRPAPAERDWMDRTTNRFAYRCLPLTIANQHGWEIINPVGFSAVWDGGDQKESIIVTPDDFGRTIAASHFGAGVLTFQINGLFRTPPGIDLMVTGPINYPKDGIYPLVGVVETDWSPMTFTYNMRFTRPRTIIRFEAGEPICTLIPTVRGFLESFSPEMMPIQSDPEEAQANAAWSQSRAGFIKRDPTGERKGEDWQKNYTQGSFQNRAPEKGTHKTSLKLNPFVPKQP